MDIHYFFCGSVFKYLTYASPSMREVRLACYLYTYDNKISDINTQKVNTLPS